MKTRIKIVQCGKPVEVVRVIKSTWRKIVECPVDFVKVRSIYIYLQLSLRTFAPANSKAASELDSLSSEYYPVLVNAHSNVLLQRLRLSILGNSLLW